MLTILSVLYTLVFFIILSLQYGDHGKLFWFSWFYAIFWPMIVVAYAILWLTATVYESMRNFG